MYISRREGLVSSNINNKKIVDFRIIEQFLYLHSLVYFGHLFYVHTIFREIRLDIHVLNHEGNVADCAGVAGLAALAHFKRPDVTLEGDVVTVGYYIL